MRGIRGSAIRVLVLAALAAELLAGAAGSLSAPGLTIQTLSAGRFHTCAVTSAAGAKCWGFNQKGQVGDGSVIDRHAPVDVQGLTSGVAAIAAGDYHTCALTTGGAVKCWGYDADGQLGNGRSGTWPSPVDVTGLQSGVTAIAAGAEHTCALTSAGAVKCWGSNAWGQLGDGTIETRSVPVDVSGLQSGVAAIAAGDDHTCALLSAGGAKCWGANRQGQLGDGTTTDSRTPVAVSVLPGGVVALTAGAEHTCVLTSGGAVDCWGWNGFGQVGDGTTTSRNVPTPVSGLQGGVFAISANDIHTCALLSTATAWCWGGNAHGELGDGTATDRHVPVFVTGLPRGGTAIAAGDVHTCVASAGGAMCWGDNDYGELGDGTTTQRRQPVDVVGFGTPKTLGVHVSGRGRGRVRLTSDGTYCATDCVRAFDYGTQLTLAAVPRSGSSFVGWLGDCSGRRRSCSFAMNADRDVIALFAPQCHVPRVVGEKLARARAAIRRAHCSTGKVTRRRAAAPKRGKVIRQSPRPGRRLANAGKVNLTIGR